VPPNKKLKLSPASAPTSPIKDEDSSKMETSTTTTATSSTTTTTATTNTQSSQSVLLPENPLPPLPADKKKAKKQPIPLNFLANSPSNMSGVPGGVTGNTVVTVVTSDSSS